MGDCFNFLDGGLPAESVLCLGVVCAGRDRHRGAAMIPGMPPGARIKAVLDQAEIVGDWIVRKGGA